MAKVKYKKVSKALENLAKPLDRHEGRISLGLEKNVGEFYYISVEDLQQFKNQARKHFSEEEINALAQSIKDHGLRQPLTVIACKDQKGKFQVISGERRLKAAKQIGLEKIPCIILHNESLAEEIAIVENIHRQDLHPIELGLAFSKLIKDKIFNTQVELAEKFSISKSKVSELISYSQIPENKQNYLIKNQIIQRDKIRQALKHPFTQDKQYNMKKSFSVMRISFKDSQLQFQTKGIAALSDSNKLQLKKNLLKIIKML